MSVALLALTLVQAAPAPEIPGGLLFGFYRVFAFHERAAELKCDGPDRATADKEFDIVRKRLIATYGAKPFSPAEPARSGPGDCRLFMPVYTLNMTEYRKMVDAALASAPVPGE